MPRLLRLRAEGRPAPAIAAELGCSVWVLHKRLRSLGVAKIASGRKPEAAPKPRPASTPRKAKDPRQRSYQGTLEAPTRGSVASAAAKARKAPGDPLGAATAERYYDDDEAEFLAAMKAFQERTGRRFPTVCEHLAVLKSLGYRKA